MTAEARPALPARRTTHSGCRAERRFATSAVPSGEPSSTTTSSQVWPDIAAPRRSPSGGSDPAPLEVGTNTVVARAGSLEKAGVANESRALHTVADVRSLG